MTKRISTHLLEKLHLAVFRDCEPYGTIESVSEINSMNVRLGSLKGHLVRLIHSRDAKRALPDENLNEKSLPKEISHEIFEMSQEIKNNTPEKLLYAAITGSAAENCWIYGWSDVDILLIVSNFDRELSESLGSHFSYEGDTPKFALSILIMQEIKVGNLRAIDHVRIRKIVNNESIILYKKNTIEVPYAKKLEKIARLSLNDLFSSILFIRRAISFDFRGEMTLYKYLGVSSKIMLRIMNFDIGNDDTAIAKLFAVFDEKIDFYIPSKSEIFSSPERYKKELKVMAERIIVMYDDYMISKIGDLH